MDRILVIEDDHSILEILDIALTSHGYDVKVAHNGIEGMELLDRDNHVNLVITDIRMPGADGNQVAKYLRDNEKMRNTHIIAISGYPAEVERELFDSVLVKPFRLKNIIELVNSFL